MNEFVANQALNRGPVAPLSKIEIVAAGKVVRAIRPQDRQEPGGGFLTSVDELLEFDGSTWVAVRCFQPAADGRFRFAPDVVIGELYLEA
jgi:hypothetical protein